MSMKLCVLEGTVGRAIKEYSSTKEALEDLPYKDPASFFVVVDETKSLTIPQTLELIRSEAIS